MPRQGTQRGAGAGREEELEQEYLAALQDFLHSKTCVLPPDTFAPGAGPPVARLLATGRRGAHQPGIRRLPVPRRLHPRPPGHGGEAEGGGRGGGHQAVGHRQAYTETYRKIRARADQV